MYGSDFLMLDIFVFKVLECGVINNKIFNLVDNNV